jgi:8-oxo-dGTP diphosphatase
MADIHKAGLLTFRENRFLMCRKNRETSRLILPGGRVEAGETELECLHREIEEELGAVSLENPQFVGRYSDIAHSDDPTVQKTLELSLYAGELSGRPVPSGEIIELVWFGKDSNLNDLTPIFSRQILPDLKRRNLLFW